ncbi:DoxX family protein [Mycolicibacterium sp. CBMA 226]|uniref:DoxX family protein n=1 Tax=Mycolicibacterium sp. CBMA 226 TaxID=2606611 RepID=UPI001412B335|nr:DoxX family protein [Mycolicibacterium sp. CBMA 226]
MDLVRVVAAILFAAVCAGSAVPTLAGAPAMRDAAEHFGISWSRYRLIGVALIAAAAGIAAGFRWPVCGVLAASGMVLLLVGAVYFHLMARDPLVKLLPAVVTLAIAAAYLAGFAA